MGALLSGLQRTELADKRPSILEKRRERLLSVAGAGRGDGGVEDCLCVSWNTLLRISAIAVSARSFGKQRCFSQFPAARDLIRKHTILHSALNGKQAAREGSKRSNITRTFHRDLCFQGPLPVRCGSRTGFLAGASCLQGPERSGRASGFANMKQQLKSGRAQVFKGR